MVPAALMGVDVARLLDRAQEMAEACRHAEGNPGLELGLSLGENWRDGRDKVCIDASAASFGLWASSCSRSRPGSRARGSCRRPASRRTGPTGRRRRCALADAYELGQEFFRWEFATAVAGSILGINPFDQPDVQAAKDKTKRGARLGRSRDVEPVGLGRRAVRAGAAAATTSAIQAFVDPTAANEAQMLRARRRGLAQATGCVVTHGFGPRYLHSTGQLHKGGPPTGLFLQVVDDTGDELAIPNQPFGFGKLIRAQAAGRLRVVARARPPGRARPSRGGRRCSSA